jgi:putative chitobiose transport system permease protein
VTTKKQTSPHSLFSNQQLWACIALPIALLTLIFIIPVIGATTMSLFDYRDNLYQPQFIGLNNYLRLFQSTSFLNATTNTAQLLLMVVPSVLVLSLIIALTVQGNFPGVSLFRFLIYSPVMMPMVITGLLWKNLLADDGLFNQALKTLGLSAIPWLSSTHWVLPALAITIIWRALGYYMMLYITRLQSLNIELYQAAQLDGATYWQQLRYITLPQLKPTFIFIATVSAIGNLKLFSEIYVMTQGGPLQASQTLGFYVYQQAFQWLDLGLATAAGLVFSAIVMVFMIIQNHYRNPENHL